MALPNIVDLILIDHQKLKDCLPTLRDANSEKRKKFLCGRSFLEHVRQHTEVEEDVLYRRLFQHSTFHPLIVRSFEEHGIVVSKIQEWEPQFKRARVFSEEMEAKLNVLAGIVEEHLKEEETELLPLMQTTLSREMLEQLGLEYMEARAISEKELDHSPELKSQIQEWNEISRRETEKLREKTQRFIDLPADESLTKTEHLEDK